MQVAKRHGTLDPDELNALRAEQADGTRRRVLAAARDLFLAHGYAGTTVAAFMVTALSVVVAGSGTAVWMRYTSPLAM